MRLVLIKFEGWSSMFRKNINRVVIVIMFLISIYGVYICYNVYRRTVSDLTSNFLDKTMIVYSSINLDYVMTLTGTEADYENPNYHTLVRYMANSFRAFENRYENMYIMKKRDVGHYVFLIDLERNEAHIANDKMFIDYLSVKVLDTVGLRFDDSTYYLDIVSRDQTISVYGPFQDVYGIWVSALVPLVCEETGETIAILGVDFDASEWNKTIANRVMYPVFLLILLYILMGFGLVIQKYSIQITNYSKRVNKQKEALSNFSLINNFNDLSTLLNQAAEQLRNTLSIDDATIWILADDKNCFVCESHTKPNNDRPSSVGKSIELQNFSKLYNNFSRGDLVAINDCSKETILHEFYKQINKPLPKSLMYTSIRKGQNIIGVVAIESFDMTHNWFPDEESFINNIASTLSQIISKQEKDKILLEYQRLSAVFDITNSFSHDFNNYLQVVLSNIEILNKKLDSNDDAKNHLRTMQLSTNDAATRVQLLQRFSGTKNKASIYDRVNINNVLSDAIKQTVHVLKQNVNNVNIIEKYSDISDILGNESELRTVFINLIENSIDAMPNGGEITIETSLIADNVSIKITDTGEGMTQDTVNRVFEPFFTTRGYAAGKGLGLVEVYNITHEHSGTVTVLSAKLGEGSCFEITLPLHDFNQSDDDQDMVLDNVIPNILWVDDEALIREIGFDMLESINCSATTAESGKQALELLASHDYDLLLTDIGMPEMDGWQLINKVHELYPNKMKIVIISGWGAQITNEQIAKNKVNSVLPKPVKMSELKKVIDELWNN